MLNFTKVLGNCYRTNSAYSKYAVKQSKNRKRLKFGEHL